MTITRNPICPSCGEEKPFKYRHCQRCNTSLKRAREQGYKEKAKREGLCMTCWKPNTTWPGHHRCRPCADKHNAQQRAKTTSLKLEVFSKYGGPVCSCCRETELDFLGIDHINNDGHLEKYSGYRLYQKIKKENFPNKYRVLCHNCNLGRYINKGICPHESKRSEVLPGLSYADAVPREFLCTPTDGHIESTSPGGGSGT